MYSTTTPRNDASVSRGQWNLDDALSLCPEAYGGYHWAACTALMSNAGIFLSYSACSGFYNFDNWAYQPSFVSSNTPWSQWRARPVLSHAALKIEPWFINGWQSYARFGTQPGLGGQIKWTRPPASISSPTITAT